jgi:hypothetical protein
MLKVTGITNAGKEILNLDMVISIEWTGKPISPPLYWRAGNTKRSLIEIGLEERSGELVSVTLVLANKVHDWTTNHPTHKDASVPHKIGVPICDITPWNDPSDFDSMFLDESSEFEVHVAQNDISIQLGIPAPISYWISSGRFTFGVDQGGILHLIQIHDLTNQEMVLMKSCLIKKYSNLQRLLGWYFKIVGRSKNFFRPKTD